MDSKSQKCMPEATQSLHSKKGCKCGPAQNTAFVPNSNLFGTPFFLSQIHLGTPANHHAHSTVTPTCLAKDSPTLRGSLAELWMKCLLLSTLRVLTTCSLWQLHFESLWDSSSHWTKTAWASSSQHGMLNNIPQEVSQNTEAQAENPRLGGKQPCLLKKL